MPHVLTLVEQFWHKVPGGTAQATERTLAALLDRNEFTATGLAAAHRPCVDRRDGGQDGALRVPDGCRLVHHRLPRPVLYESWLRLGRPRVDRLLGPDSLFWASSLIVAPCRRPVVSTVHDLDFLDHPEFLTARGRRFFPLMWDVARRRSDHFVCPSVAVAEQCRASGVPDELVSVVPWGVDQPLVAADDANAVLARSVPSLPAKFVLLVAPDSPRKNPEGCAAALAATDCPAVIVGSMPEGTHDPFATLGSPVVRLGPVDARVLSALYHRATALLFPSHREGYGLPVAEAMAHGLPVVTSRGTATEEVAAGAASLIDPLDHSDIAATLEQVLNDDAARRSMVAKGLDRAAELTWEQTAKGYSEIFGMVL
ncbi:MAG: glycosyltransferase family 4 protein [Acidimicrobiia bacterium]|nr:glycosyltransferase family 4 protein [Acidimicrobiia bacterium]